MVTDACLCFLSASALRLGGEQTAGGVVDSSERGRLRRAADSRLRSVQGSSHVIRDRPCALATSSAVGAARAAWAGIPSMGPARANGRVAIELASCAAVDEVF